MSEALCPVCSNGVSCCDCKPRKFLTRPAVIDWLQWSDFKEKMGDIEYPRLTLELIAEYKSAYDQAIKQRDLALEALERAVLRVTNLHKGIGHSSLESFRQEIKDIMEGKA